MTRSWRIYFTRQPDANEIESFYPHEDDAPDYVPDETEFDTDAETMEAICVDLMNLFNRFICENHFEDVTVDEITEVPYDGEEE